MIFGVIGKPILHSLSPEIHRAALQAAQIPGEYIRICADSVDEAVALAREVGVDGINVTAPYKEDAYRLVNHHDEASRSLESCNTLLLQERSIDGFNTDYYGVSQALLSIFDSVKGKKSLVIGAGGAGRAAAYALLSLEANVTIANRTQGKGGEVAKKIGCASCGLTRDALSKVLPEVEIIISTAPVDNESFPFELLSKKHVIFDAIYKEETPLVKAAKKSGCKLVHGAEWLIYQAMRAFEIFNERSAQYEVMKKAFYESKRNRPAVIALIGMMGSGKSTFGKALAEKLNKPFFDLDREFEGIHKKSIGDYIRENGEEKFRTEESVVLKEFLAKDGSVIACGGGIILSQQNRMLLKERALPVLLWSSAATLASRVAGDNNRPLLDGGDPAERISRLLHDRKSLYLETSEMIISTEVPDEKKITDRIIYEINSTWSC